MPPAVSMRHVTRRFGPVVANDDVSVDLFLGEIHALVGENGAGKTTLMRILYGLLQPDSGSFEISGQPLRIRSPADAIRWGIGMVHQHFMLIDALTVAENVTLGREPRPWLGAFNRRAAEREVAALGERIGLPVDPRARVGRLSVGAQQRVEILRAIYHGAQVLILDEPTAVLAPHEVDELFRALRELHAHDATIVLITHKLAEVKALAHRVTVMRDGRVVGGGPVQELSTETIAEMMIGRPPAALRARRATVRTVPLLSARMLDVRDDLGLARVKGVSLNVHGGEIVGIAGVEGNGQHELVECLAGLRPPSRGEIVIAGQVVSGRSAREHAEAGLSHVPSDRLRRGLVPDMNLAENLILGRQRSREVGWGPFLDPFAIGRRARRLLPEYDVRPPQPRLKAAQLSGGNQQKLVAARELSRGTPVALVAHPTRGVDLGAVEFLHSRLLEERDAGRAILIVSSDLAEIMALSDRIVVMYEGMVVHETEPARTDERTLGLYMTGKRPVGAVSGSFVSPDL